MLKNKSSKEQEEWFVVGTKDRYIYFSTTQKYPQVPIPIGKVSPWSNIKCSMPCVFTVIPRASRIATKLQSRHTALQPKMETLFDLLFI